MKKNSRRNKRGTNVEMKNKRRQKNRKKSKYIEENKKIRIDSNQEYMYWLLITYDERVIWWLLF